MPLEAGKRQKAISHNIAVERHDGKPEKQAIAIAESNARRTGDGLSVTAAEKKYEAAKNAYGMAKERDAMAGRSRGKRSLATERAQLRMTGAYSELMKARSEAAQAKDDLQPVGAEDPERAVALKRHEEGLTKSQDKKRTKDMKARDIQASEIREKLGISESDWTALSKEERQKKATEAVRAKDDVEPIAIRSSRMVPMPSGENNEASYAPVRRTTARDRGRFVKAGDIQSPSDMSDSDLEKEIDQLASKTDKTKLENARLGFLTDEEVKRKKAKATDSIATLPFQTSGSEPADHMLRANQYEVLGDRARALDSYRAAATGYRRSNDRVNEAKARDGIAACQTKFAHQYDHPGKGRVKVCDSASVALRTAIERTRAGEAVSIVGTTVRPGRARAADSFAELKRQYGDKYSDDVLKRAAASGREPWSINPKATDEHEGFAKLKGELAHEKGVTNPAAVAASIGRKKYGAEGMAKKAAAGKAKDAEIPTLTKEKPHHEYVMGKGGLCKVCSQQAGSRFHATDREVQPV